MDEDYLAKLLEFAIEIFGVHRETARKVSDPLIVRLNKSPPVVLEVGLENVYCSWFVEVLFDCVGAEHEAFGNLYLVVTWLEVDLVNPRGPRENLELVEQHRFAGILKILLQRVFVKL